MQGHRALVMSLVAVPLAASFSTPHGIALHTRAHKVAMAPTRPPRDSVSLSAGRGGLGEDYLDPYIVLGVPKTATPEDIKAAYRRLSRTYHPDVNQEKNAQEKFIIISRAYSILGDEDEKRKFDFSGRMGLAPDFAERVSGFREAAGPEYNRAADAAEGLIENKWAVAAFSTFMPVMLLLTTTVAKDWLHDLVLGPR